MNTAVENTTTNRRFSLKKAEILRSKKVIEKLFSEGDWLVKYPLKMVYLKTTLPPNSRAQAGFSASKKAFKRAVHRNRIKRLLRNAYRLNKYTIYDALENEQLALFVIYIGTELPDYQSVEKAMQKSLKKIAQKLHTTGSEE